MCYVSIISILYKGKKKTIILHRLLPFICSKNLWREHKTETPEVDLDSFFAGQVKEGLV